jgi:hypothetical protein
LDEDFSTFLTGLAVLAAFFAAASTPNVDTLSVEDALLIDGDAAARETAFGAPAPTLPDNLPGAISPLLVEGVWCFTGFFIAFAMESTNNSLRAYAQAQILCVIQRIPAPCLSRTAETAT